MAPLLGDGVCTMPDRRRHDGTTRVVQKRYRCSVKFWLVLRPLFGCPDHAYGCPGDGSAVGGDDSAAVQTKTARAIANKSDFAAGFLRALRQRRTRGGACQLRLRRHGALDAVEEMDDRLRDGRSQSVIRRPISGMNSVERQRPPRHNPAARILIMHRETHHELSHDCLQCQKPR